MKVLVLGGTGAMGVDLVRILAEQGKNVTVTSRTPHKSGYQNVHYVQGNAHDTVFLKELLTEHYDAIVDFMIYSTEEFKIRRDIFLNSTDQYLFLSSSRVYADSKDPITEDSPRLLDVTTDEEYLKTDEYALAKARQENLLFESGRRNWTIVRPYITYSSKRLQLGVYEKELWLYRALNGRTTVFPKDIAAKYTTMTCGKDVARGISRLINNEKARGEIFNIVTDEAIQWSDVLDLYTKTFKEVADSEIKVKFVNECQIVYRKLGEKYRNIYDRMFNRKFDNCKFKAVVGEFDFIPLQIGLVKSFEDFLKNPEFISVSCATIARMDKLTNEWSIFPDNSKRIKYLICRCFPNMISDALRKHNCKGFTGGL